jgi:hypothetical protein
MIHVILIGNNRKVNTNMSQLDKEKQAILIARRCQRNWDKEKTIPQEHIDHWIYLCENSPSKQDECRYALAVVTDEKTRDVIYDEYSWGSHRRGIDAGRNTQAGGSALFIFGDTERTDFGGDDQGIDPGEKTAEGFDYRSDINFNRDIGIAMGIVSFSAANMGYVTGFNTNVIYNNHGPKDWQKLLGMDYYFCPKVVLSIGYPDPNLQWYESNDLEYIYPDPRETDLDNKTMLEDYPGVRKKWTDIKVRTFGPISADPKTGKPYKKGLKVKVI